MPRLPGALCTKSMAVFHVVALAPVGRMPAGGVVTRRTGPWCVIPPPPPSRCPKCTDRREKDIAHVSGSGSCPAFQTEFRGLRGGKWSSYSLTSKGSGSGESKTSCCRRPERGADLLFINEQYKWSENSAWYQDALGRAGILACNPEYAV